MTNKVIRNRVRGRVNGRELNAPRNNAEHALSPLEKYPLNYKYQDILLLIHKWVKSSGFNKAIRKGGRGKTTVLLISNDYLFHPSFY